MRRSVASFEGGADMRTGERDGAKTCRSGAGCRDRALPRCVGCLDVDIPAIPKADSRAVVRARDCRALAVDNDPHDRRDGRIGLADDRRFVQPSDRGNGFDSHGGTAPQDLQRNLS